MRRRSLLLLLPALAAAALAIGGLRPEAPAKTGGPDRGTDDPGAVRIVDGDTLRIGAHRVRLYGIDAPERAQNCDGADRRPYPCGAAASAALTRMIGGARPDCAERDRDRYGRSVAVCSVAGRDLNRAMVAAGWAVAYVRYSRDYERDEAAARRARLGIWRGSFERPDVYRSARRRRG